MRTVIYAINLTLDGCCDHAKQFVDAEKFAYFTQLTREAGLQVYGRKTYELMVPYWPDVLNRPSATQADADFARAFVALEKVVFSRTLASVEGGNTRVLRGNLREEILNLKQEGGKPMLVGGVDVAGQLAELGLVDEFRLAVGPTIAGEGRRLWDGLRLPERLRLQLVETTAFQSGGVVLRYQKGN